MVRALRSSAAADADDVMMAEPEPEPEPKKAAEVWAVFGSGRVRWRVSWERRENM